VELPVSLDALPADEPKVDIGNHLFWPNFSTMPMIDFFLWALGLDPADIPSQEKRNAWLQRLALPELAQGWQKRPYVLLAPTASTPVRSIPSRYLPEIVSRLWAEFRLPVAGFFPIAHERYINVSSLSGSTASFLAWVRNATLLVTSDSSALHVGAGFDVPTAAFFTTIPSGLRARDYPKCAAIDLPVPALTGIHASARPADLALIERAYARLAEVDWIGALRARAA
jgi:ADP-heptose:LPS heptosyltransferase